MMAIHGSCCLPEDDLLISYMTNLGSVCILVFASFILALLKLKKNNNKKLYGLSIIRSNLELKLFAINGKHVFIS